MEPAGPRAPDPGLGIRPPRSGSDGCATKLYASREAADHAVVEAVAQVAAARGVPRSQVALAWAAQRRGVSALEAPYVPHAVMGFD